MEVSPFLQFPSSLGAPATRDTPTSPPSEAQLYIPVNHRPSHRQPVTNPELAACRSGYSVAPRQNQSDPFRDNIKEGLKELWFDTVPRSFT